MASPNLPLLGVRIVRPTETRTSQSRANPSNVTMEIYLRTCANPLTDSASPSTDPPAILVEQPGSDRCCCLLHLTRLLPGSQTGIYMVHRRRLAVSTCTSICGRTAAMGSIRWNGVCGCSSPWREGDVTLEYLSEPRNLLIWISRLGLKLPMWNRLMVPTEQ